MNDDDSDLVVPVSARDHVEGDAHAPVTLVEYGDYQCPY
ncbi:MAG TPA: DsbA family protein, partial [Casimicrobiaceae bacterium]|nr:DsbA family protein [Casimicrobiaceae bacterium]